MPDNWNFVLAAYALAAIVLGGYWRNLIKREREAQPRVPVHRHQAQPRPSLSAQPRSKPASRPPLQ